jgi:hypothetical protein
MNCIIKLIQIRLINKKELYNGATKPRKIRIGISMESRIRVIGAHLQDINKTTELSNRTKVRYHKIHIL